MRGVYFDNDNTADDWGLILNNKTLAPPLPKHIVVSVDGRDGDLDLSEALTGEIKYNNRDASFIFLICSGTQSSREDLISEITNAIHGQQKEIILPDDPDHYLVGRCTITEVHNDKAYGTIKVSANCEPYRYAVTEVNRAITVSGSSRDVILTNTGRKTVTPTVVVTGSVTIAYGSTSIALSAGTYKLTALLLKTGTTTVTVGGSGTATFTYREGVL